MEDGMNMKIKTTLSCLLLLCFFASAAFAKDAETVNMKPGMEEFRDVGSIKRISVADPSIVDTKVLSGGKQVMIRAIKPGDTTVTIFDDSENKIIYKVSVLSSMGEVAEKVRDMIKDVQTLNVKVIDDQIVITGSVVREKDKTTLNKALELYSGIKVLAEDKIKSKKDFVINALQSELPTSVTAKLLGEGVMLEGKVNTPGQKNEVERLAKEYFENVYSVIGVENSPCIVTVNPVEFNSKDMKAGVPSAEVTTLAEGLELEKGLFGMILEDDSSADSFVQSLMSDYSGSNAWDGMKDFTENGQYEMVLPNGEKYVVYFQFEVVKQEILKVSVSVLDSQKKVLFRNDFFSKKIESIAVAGIYRALYEKAKLDLDKEVVLVFNLKS
jgi:hypothetical protein